LINQEGELREPFVFVLKQNYGPQIQSGLLGYRAPINTARLNPKFFIGIGQLEIVVGPFETTGELTTGIFQFPQVGRLEEINPDYGIYKLTMQYMPWTIPFKKLAPTKMGLKWDYVAKVLDINPKKWKCLITVSLNPAQITELDRLLREANST